MKPKYRSPLVFFPCLILGFLLASRIGYGTVAQGQILTFQNYQNATSEIKKLTDEINILNEKKGEMEQDISKYENMGQSSSEVLNKFTDDISKYEYQSGLTDVEGPGVVILLADNPMKDDPNVPVPPEIIEATLVHDKFIRDIVWELKNAGAEAISVNDQRVVSNTEFYCEGPVMRINNTVFASPYTIKAIGDPDALAYVLNDSKSTYKSLEDNGLLVNFRKENTIKIFKYEGPTGNSYMKSTKEGS